MRIRYSQEADSPYSWGDRALGVAEKANTDQIIVFGNKHLKRRRGECER
jgi:hypothetical protein